MWFPSGIDNMDGHRFEYYCADILKRNGYKNVRVTPGSGDNGVDILAERNGASYAIQCKCYKNKLGNKAVQEVYSGCTYYNCDVAVVLTNSYFTEPAKDAARKLGVILWDRKTLLAMDRAPRIATPANAADQKMFTQPTEKKKSSISAKKKRSSFVPAIIVLFLIVFIFSRGKTSNTNTEKNDEIRNTTNTQISTTEEWTIPLLDDFEYSYQNKAIILEKYRGTATSIIIPQSYEVEGTVLPVHKLDGTFAKYTSLNNLIISEGVEYIQYNTFRKTNNIQHIFLPASMTGSSSILEIFSDGEILYYGGTEEQWHSLCGSTHWSEIGFKRIVFNASPDDCIANIDTIISEISDVKTDSAPISDFVFDCYRNEITIISYLGSEKYLKIASTYEVNGEDCPVVAFGNSFIRGKVDTVIIPEGVLSLSKATFNSSGVTTVYLPSSIIFVPEGFWGYFHDVDTIYYGGSEDDFKSICADRWDIDVKHMIYNASPDDVPRK